MKFKVGDKIRFIGEYDPPPNPDNGVVDRIASESYTFPYICSFGNDTDWPMREKELDFRKESKIQRILDKIDGKLHKS